MLTTVFRVRRYRATAEGGHSQERTNYVTIRFFYTSVLVGICVWLVAGSALGAPVLLIKTVGALADPSGCHPGMSGICYAGGTQYYAVNDSGGLVNPANISVNPATGAITAATFDPAITMGGVDLEGVAYNAARNSVWVSDETEATIKEYSFSGVLLDTVAVPTVFKSYRDNFSLESLTVRGDGLEMWTCNEEALYNKATGVDDGPLSTASAGSVVRLQRFARSSVHGVWAADGQWAYLTESFVKDSSHTTLERSGVSDLCVLPDGSLLVLERRLGGGGAFPMFENHIYQVDFTGATDISDILALNAATYTRVSKTKLWIQSFWPIYNFEGIALGPRLNDEALSLILIADGDAPQTNALHALTLNGLATRNLSVTSAHGVAEPVGSPYRYMVGSVLTNTVTSPITMGSTQHVCTGWALSGGDSPASGATNMMVMTIGNDGDLTWLWATNYWIDVAVVGSGSVSSGEGWYRADTSTALTAIPDSGFELDYWSGDVPFGEIENISISITPATPLRVTAHFRIVPIDGTVDLLN